MNPTIITGDDLIALGYPQSKVIAIVLQAVEAGYANEPRATVLAELRKLLQYPENFLDDETLGPVARALGEEAARQEREAEIPLREQAEDYAVFGAENIEPGASAQMNVAMKLPVTVAGALMPDAHQGYGLPIQDQKSFSKFDNHGKLIATITPFTDNKLIVGITFYGGYIWCEAQEGTNILDTKDQTLVKIDATTGAVVASIPMSNSDIRIDGVATVNTYVFATEDGIYTLVDKYTFSTLSCKLYKVDIVSGARTFVKSTARPYIGNVAYSGGYLYIQTLNKVVRMPVSGSDGTQTDVADYYAKYGSPGASVKLVSLCGKMYALTRKVGSTDPLDVNKLN